MKKGFLSFIAILAIFLVAIIMVNINYQDNETISFKEIMLDSKVLLVNYELAMNRAMDGREISETTIDGNSSEILAIIEPAFTDCQTNNIVVNGNTATVDLRCTTEVFVRRESVFKNIFYDTITING